MEEAGATGPLQKVPKASELADTVYSQLRVIAQAQMNSERPGHTLTATALVHEAYLRLGSHDLVTTLGSGAFYYAAAQAMRRILIERARARNRVKRGGGNVKVSLDAIGDVVALDLADEGRGEFVLAFDEAFGRLEEREPHIADVVRLRFFAGLGVRETASALDVSERTVDNRWAFARAWLARELRTSGETGSRESMGAAGTP